MSENPHYIPADDFLPVEPRIYSIKKELEQILKFIDPEFDGRKVEVDGFNLKNLENWKTSEVNSALDALTPLSGKCNCNCVFCFEKGHPFRQNHSIMSIHEAKTRLKYYSPDGDSLFPSDRVFKETFLNPDAIRILKLAREKDPDQLFHLTSNGTFLTKDVIYELSKLQPIILTLSVNCINKDIRADLMGPNNRSEIVLGAPEYLKEFKIPFIGSIVAWPGLSDEEMISTIMYLDHFDPYAIRIRLPIFHQYQYKDPPFDTDFHWSTVKRTVDNLLPKVTVPLIVEPALYWVTSIIPTIDGIIKNSPAFKSGLRRGDLIQFINNEGVHSRTHAISKLAVLKHSGEQKVKIKISRGQKKLNITVDASSHEQETSYPYDPCASLPQENYGIFFVNDFRLDYINHIIKIIDNYKAAEILLFSTPVVKQIFENIVDAIPNYRSYFQEKKLKVVTLDHTLLGGNCLLLDGRLVDDFIAQIKKVIKHESVVPELILIPAAFGSGWGFDLFRKSFKEIERVFDIPVEIIPWSIIYGREV